jgi:hypothetical protein
MSSLLSRGWEGEFDEMRARVFGTLAEAELDLNRGNAAFAESVASAD